MRHVPNASAGRVGSAACESTCCPVSTRPRCTAAPACTSPSWSARCAPGPTSRPTCTRSARRATRPLTSSYADLAELAGANAGAAHARASTWRSRTRCAGTDLVHSHTWYANFAGHLAVAAARRPARRVRALARAAAAVEGRAARRRLRDLVVRRADVVRGGRRGDRGVGGDARRRARVVPRDRPGPRARRAQRHRHRRLVADREPGPGARARRRPGPAVGGLRRPDHPAEGAAAVPARVSPSCRPRCRSCCAPARRTPRRSWPRSRRWSTSCATSRTGVVWIRRDAAAPRRRRAADRRDGVRLPVDLRAARHREPRGDGLRDRRRRHRHRRHPRGRRRTARPGGWCRSCRPPTAPARRWTRTSTSPTSPRR